MSSETFNALLLDISNQLKEDDLTKMKFLLGDHVGKRDLEKITSGHGLFQVLRERALLGPEDRDFLNGLLKSIARYDLSEKLEQEPAPYRGPSEEETAKLDVASRVISENLGKSWRKLGRRLRVSEVRMDSISKRHPTELEETTMELLKEWRKNRKAEARTEDLVKALRDCQFNLTADKVEDELRAEGL